MKITVEIPENRYQQPTEVRQDVVQAICTYVTNEIAYRSNVEGRHHEWCMINWFANNPALRLDYYESDKKKEGPLIDFGRAKKEEGEIQIRSVEMYAACEALQKAGYYITYDPNTHPGETFLHFTKVPMFGGLKAEEHFVFNDNIDIYDSCKTEE